MSRELEAVAAGQRPSPAARRGGVRGFAVLGEGTAALDAPTLSSVLAEAARRDASHVHFDPLGFGAALRVRSGGSLVTIGTLSAEQAGDLFAAVEARMGTGHSFSEGETVVGVSTLATRDGMRMVLRLSPEDRAAAALSALGMRAPLLAALRPALSRGGLILLAGGAGAGTTTSLRSVLRHLAEGQRRVVAIEPVPGPRIEGVAQAAIGAALAPIDALRVARDQDVDAIGIDGIGDRAIAAQAVEAAQDGLLVVATIAAADAVGAIRRMREWRIGPFALASTLNLVVAQRRVRRLCPECRIPVQAQGSVSALLGFDPGAIVYAADGCGTCDGTGYAGEIGVFEAIAVDSSLRRLLNDGGDESILARHAFVRAPNLGSAARALVREGVTTPEEAVRVSRG